MSKPTVIILGATGMLGSVTLDSFVRCDDFTILATYRNEPEVQPLKEQYPSVEFRHLDAEKASIDEIGQTIAGSEWVVNAIGVIKPHIHDDNAQETERALRINSLFPYLLGKAAAPTNTRVLQIATDCTYSGIKGQYTEADLHDATDVYGKTKSLGEAFLDNVHHIRCSIIGPELKLHVSLMDWFLGQDQGATLSGYTNHQWNGVTTLHFARICQGIIKENIEMPHLQHVIPGNLITKANLLKSFAKEYAREDITINSVEAPKVVDRTLATTNQDLNEKLWRAAGYETAPTVEQMVNELATFSASNSGGK